MSEEKQTKPKRSFLRWLLLAFGGLCVLFLLFFLGLFISYKTGYLDNYVKDSLIERFTEYGIRLEIGSVKTTLSPTTTELSNLQFFDAQTGEKLGKLDKLRLDLTLTNLLGLREKREININSTDVEGLEVWVKFDETGKSNFSNLKFKVSEDSNLKVTFASMNFNLKDAIVHYGDELRKISGTANNIKVFVEPENTQVAENERRYKFDLSSEKSVFNYNEKPIEPIDVFAKGIADKNGAEIEKLTLKTPLGESVLSGTINDWQSPKYNLKLSSNVDLQQTANVLPTGAVLRGTGNFEGVVTGEGEKYQVDGEIQSDALSADNIYLKALQINGKVNGENSIYEAQGKAVAEMLTAGDFIINFPSLVGNLRGNGTDFKWFGELRAAALKHPSGSIAGMILSDAIAEYNDKQLKARIGNATAKSFSSPEVEAAYLKANGIIVNYADGSVNLSAPNLQAKTVDTKDASLRGVNASDLKVKNQNGKTDVSVGDLRAENLETQDTKLKNVATNGIEVTNQGDTTTVASKRVTADNVETRDGIAKNVSADNLKLQNRKGQTDVSANNVKAGSFASKDAKLDDVSASILNVKNIGGNTEISAENVLAGNIEASDTKIANLDSQRLNVQIVDGKTIVNAENSKIGKIVTIGAELGNLNVAGVRLSIREGYIEGNTSDINAGNIDLKQNGNLQKVLLKKPVFVVEPSGKYRASMDVSLGGGILGSVKIGEAQAKVTATNEKVELNNLNANVMEGKVIGDAVIALNKANNSSVKADFSELDLAKLLALQGGKVDLSFRGTDFKNASGSVYADFKADAGTAERGKIPITGRLGAKAVNGLFDLDYANFNTEKSSLMARGKFDLSGNGSNLNLDLNSSDAKEVQRLIKVLGVADELDEQLTSLNAEIAGNLNFNGTLTGKIDNPNLVGRASLESVRINDKSLGSLSGNISSDINGFTITDGILNDGNGGTVSFNLQSPKIGKDNIAVQATLKNYDAGLIFQAFPQYIPERLKDFRGLTSGNIEITGLPNQAKGLGNLYASNGRILGEDFDKFNTKITLENSLVKIETGEIYFGNSYIRLFGTYDRSTTDFDFNFVGSDIETERLSRIFVNNPSFPKIKGLIQLSGKAVGKANDFASYNVSFSGAGSKLTINENELGGLAFDVRTENKILSSVLLISFPSHQQKVVATVDLGNKNLPLKAETEFYQTELAPFIALFQTPESVAINGKATGKVTFGGNLVNDKKEFVTDDLKGVAEFSEFGVQFNDTPLVATKPIRINFSVNEATVDNANFAGAGSNFVVNGTKAFNENGINNLGIDGTINLRVLDNISRNTFFSGLADVSVRLTGVNKDSRLSGQAKVENTTISTFVGSERLSFDRIRSRVLFNSNQAQIDYATGYLGGGKVTGTGGAMVEGLKLQQFRLELHGRNVTAPLPRNYLTNGDADINITGKRDENNPNDFNTIIAGSIIAKRSSYTKDIDLADVIGGRKDRTLNEGATQNFFGIPKLDLTIEGRDALYVKNNLADLVASVSLRVTGDVDYPIVSGTMTAAGGTLFFRNDRYELKRGVLQLPAESTKDPIINLQAEADIKGYQVTVDLAGELSDVGNLSIVARSNPNLPQADVVSLITTGNLSNTDTGIPTLAQSGINTAAGLLTDSLINNPTRKATDKLFGLNKFEIDPILSGKRLTPTARLTVGRQINKNLAVTYSTNLSSERNQVLAVEYRVSNRVSFVAQYEQNAGGDITKRDNFSFEVRLRKRF
jgi:translocation and assembly module TamB